jgi:hypothetical protein
MQQAMLAAMIPRHRNLIAVGVTCALAGSAAGIAVTSASTSKTQRNAPATRDGDGRGKLGALGIGGPPVHEDLVVPNGSGGFETVTMDQGTFKSLSGGQLTITEGTQTATYKTLTLNVPSNATIMRDDQTAHLSDIKTGDMVRVLQTPSATRVAAFSANFKPSFGPGMRHGHFGSRFGAQPPGASDPAPPATTYQ